MLKNNSAAQEKWQAVVKTVAPTLALALGGPLAGLAAQMISENLFPGKKKVLSHAELAKLLGGQLVGGGKVLEQLRQAEKQFAVELRKLDIEISAIDAADRASARHRQQKLKDSCPNIMGLMVLTGFFVTVGFVLTYGLDHLSSTTAAFAGTMVGYVSAKADQVIAYFFGSSSGSREKTRAMADVLHTGNYSKR